MSSAIGAQAYTFDDLDVDATHLLHLLEVTEDTLRDLDYDGLDVAQDRRMNRATSLASVSRELAERIIASLDANAASLRQGARS